MPSDLTNESTMDSLDMNNYELLDLPDEILLIIIEKLQSFDVLYSVVGVNKRLNNIAANVISRSNINLVKTSSTCSIRPLDKSELDQLCLYTLPQMHHHIKSMLIEFSSVECILNSGDYPNLFILGLIRMPYALSSNYFSNNSSIIRLLKQQITDLYLSFRSDLSMISTYEFSKNVYARIFILGEKLTTLNFCNADFCQQSLSFDNLPPNTCQSSTLLYLNISVANFDDGLTLLDGRLPQLSTFHLIIRHVDQSSLSIDNTVILPKLKCFSLKSYQLTFMYDNQIVPLLRRMSNLEILTLFLIIQNRVPFIDGNHLDNEILVHMSRLTKFDFNIRTLNGINNGIPLQSTEDIQRSFTNNKYSKVICWTDKFLNGTSHCNIFSLPFTMKQLDGITNSFPGGIFPSVCYLSMLDIHPFEHEFLYFITQAFPSMTRLRLANMKPQLHKQKHWQSDDEHSSIVIYPNLRILDLSDVHIDYVEEFLHDYNSRLPCLKQLQVKYEQLAIVTNNFTNDKTRENCSHLKLIHIDDVTVYSKNFYSYFPLLV